MALARLKPKIPVSKEAMAVTYWIRSQEERPVSLTAIQHGTGIEMTQKLITEGDVLGLFVFKDFGDGRKGFI